MNRAPHRTAISPEERAKRYLLAMEQVADYAVFLLDVDGIILDWNHGAEVMRGYTAEEAIGQYFGILYTDDCQAEGHPRSNLEAAARDGTFQEETWRTKKDGSLFWAHVEVIAYYEENGDVRGVLQAHAGSDRPQGARRPAA